MLHLFYCTHDGLELIGSFENLEKINKLTANGAYPEFVEAYAVDPADGHLKLFADGYLKGTDLAFGKGYHRPVSAKIDQGTKAK